MRTVRESTFKDQSFVKYICLITSITSTMLSLQTWAHHLHHRHDVVPVDRTSSPPSQARCCPCKQDLITSITGTMFSLQTRLNHLHHKHDVVPADTTSSPPSQARCCPWRHDFITSITSAMLSLQTRPHHLHQKHDVVPVDCRIWQNRLSNKLHFNWFPS
jgi:uncharacterized CHY-type Zn-finger protein